MQSTFIREKQKTEKLINNWLIIYWIACLILIFGCIFILRTCEKDTNPAMAAEAYLPKTSKSISAPATTKITGTVTAYNAEECQTDSRPREMASGKEVYIGAIANNCLKFGTLVEIDGETYTVEDRMNRRYNCDNFDIYMESRAEAVKFGRQAKNIKIYLN